MWGKAPPKRQGAIKFELALGRLIDVIVRTFANDIDLRASLQVEEISCVSLDAIVRPSLVPFRAIRLCQASPSSNTKGVYDPKPLDLASITFTKFNQVCILVQRLHKKSLDEPSCIVPNMR